MGGIWVFIPPKSAQVNSSWGKNDVRTAIQQFYTPPPKKKLLYPQTNFWLRPCKHKFSFSTSACVCLLQNELILLQNA